MKKGGRDGYLYVARCLCLRCLTITLKIRQTTESLMSAFRFQARYALITYSQCGDLDPFTVSDHFSILGAECIIGREMHVDGGCHLHAFIDFGKKFNSRNTRVFDVGGCHLNIEQSRGKPWVGYDYAIKDGDVVAGGLDRPDEPDGSGNSVPNAHERWTQIVAAETRGEFFELLSKLDPSAMVRSWTQCRAYADHRYRVDRDRYITPDGVHIDTEHVEELSGWVRENLLRFKDGGMYLVAFFHRLFITVRVTLKPPTPEGAPGGRSARLYQH
nr:replication associated protein [Flumine genomovirus 2]